MGDQRAQIDWRDDVPVSRVFDDPYYSLDNGVAETRHVFLEGNDLPRRFVDGFHIAELGFGTGLNLAVALDAWRASGAAGRLHFTSFEAFPMTSDDMARAQAAFPEVAALQDMLRPLWRPESFVAETEDLRFELIVGDARETVPAWCGQADAWFLDGFSPAKNPELWEADLLTAVGEHTNEGGTFATYTAAGDVRRALDAAGFEISRVPGFGRKRHMTRGVLR